MPILLIATVNPLQEGIEIPKVQNFYKMCSPPVEIQAISSILNSCTRGCSFGYCDTCSSPRVPCVQHKYSGKSSCKIVTRVYCRYSVASRHEKSPPYPVVLSLYDWPCRVLVTLGMLTWTTTYRRFLGKAKRQRTPRTKVATFLVLCVFCLHHRPV